MTGAGIDRPVDLQDPLAGAPLDRSALSAIFTFARKSGDASSVTLSVQFSTTSAPTPVAFLMSSIEYCAAYRPRPGTLGRQAMSASMRITDSSWRSESARRRDKSINIMDIPVGVRPLFVAAGWQSGRRVRVDRRVPQLHQRIAYCRRWAVFMLVGPNLEASNAPVPTWSFAFAKRITICFRLGVSCFGAGL